MVTGAFPVMRPSIGDIGSCATLAQFSFLQFATSDPVWCAPARRRARTTWPR